MRRSVTWLIPTLTVVLAASACAGDANDASGAPKPAAAPEAHAGHATFTAPPPAPLRAGERFLTVSVPRPYTPDPPSAGGTDDYRCFLVDPGVTQAGFLTGSQFLPQNADIVHHAIFYRVDPADVGEAQRVDTAAPGDGWTCFGGPGVGTRRGGFSRFLGSTPWISAWAPGSKEWIATPGVGYEMPPGSKIIMQVHYNLLATGGKATSTDRSSIRLRLAPAGAGLQPLRTTLLTAPVELPCPPGESGDLCMRSTAVVDTIRRFGERAGATVSALNLACNSGQAPRPGNTQHCDRRARENMVVRAVAGHMHLLGRSIKVELNPGTPRAQTLLDVPAYDFDNQGARLLAKPVAVAQGETFRVTCTHDATLRRKLPELRTLQPRYVVWGDGTSDEMCLGVLVWSAR
jgi:hypothetical protein